MSRYITVGGVKVLCIESEPEEICEYCGKIAETRPYGKNGARICFDCAMSPENKTETEKQFGLMLRGPESEVTQ